MIPTVAAVPEPRRRSRRRPAGDPLLAVAVLRTSTSAQQLGPEGQRHEIEEWAKAKGIAIAAWHVDHVSGRAPLDERPDILAALEDVKRVGAGFLVFHERSRLTRAGIVFAELLREMTQHLGARLVTADDVPDGDEPDEVLHRGVHDLFAQYAVAKIRAHTRLAMQAKIRRGETTGNIRFGYRLAADGVHVVEDRDEQKAIRAMVRLFDRGAGYLKICQELDRLGYAPRRGAWSPARVRTIIMRTKPDAVRERGKVRRPAR